MMSSGSSDFSRSVSESRLGKRHQVPAFLLSLFGLLEETRIREVISWSEDGASFCISQPIVFIEDICPKYFRLKNYTSFIRQLNIYGFKKGKNVEGHDYFSQPMFSRERRDLLQFITRKRKTTASATKPTQPNSAMLLLTETLRLKRAQEQLEKNIELMNTQAEASDLYFQKTLAELQHKEMQTQLGLFAVMTLSSYIDSQGKSVLPLEFAQIASINQQLHQWMGEEPPASSCTVAFRVCITFSIGNECLPCKKFEQVCKLTADFRPWLQNFMLANQIDFPYVDTFFGVLIIHCIHERRSMQEKVRENSTLAKLADCIHHAFDSSDSFPITVSN